MKFFIIFGIIKWIDMFVPRFVASNPLSAQFYKNPFLCGEMKNIEIYSRITFFIFIDLKNLLRLDLTITCILNSCYCVPLYCKPVLKIYTPTGPGNSPDDHLGNPSLSIGEINMNVIGFTL
jgi:hypothetical protein